MNERARSSPGTTAPRRAGVPTLAATGITKTFGTLLANDGIDFAIHPGEIHALLGENGAGKSTLVKILYGALQPDAGEIRWQGEPVEIANPAAARRLGIGMVFQHFSLFEALSVAENIALALDHERDMVLLKERIRAVSNDYGLPLNPDSIIADLSVGERQRVEIVRCLLQEPRLLIMDEPTSVLTPQEADDLFATLYRLADDGCSVLYISHHLEEVRRICHHATILRHGKVVAECDPQRESAARLASLMVGAELREVHAEGTATSSAPARLEITELSLPRSSPFGIDLKSVSLEVRAGEIVGIAGIAGNGQGELFAALSGERLAGKASVIRIDNKNCGRRSVTARRRLGAAFIPEERLGHGAVPRLPLSENVVLTRHSTGDSLVRSHVLDRKAAARIASRVASDYDVRKGSPDPEATALSGGNLQKFVVGREIDRRPGVLVVSQPTWGVDAGAATTIRQALVDLAKAGSAVLMISQDLDEILEIADRVAVMSHGRLSRARPTGEMSREAIGLLMGGHGHDQAREAVGGRA